MPKVGFCRGETVVLGWGSRSLLTCDSHVFKGSGIRVTFGRTFGPLLGTLSSEVRAGAN